MFGLANEVAEVGKGDLSCSNGHRVFSIRLEKHPFSPIFCGESAFCPRGRYELCKQHKNTILLCRP